MGETVFPGNKAHGSIRIDDFGSLVNGDTVTIGTKIFEFRTSGSAGVGHVQVNVGADNAETADNLKDAIIANPPSPLVDAYIDDVDDSVVRLEARNHGTLGNIAFSASMTGAGNVIDQTSGFLVGGENGSLKHLDSDRYTVRQLDVDAECIMIPTKLTSPKILSIQIFAADGTLKNDVTTKWTPSDSRIKGALDGVTDPVAGDVVAWSARD